MDTIWFKWLLDAIIAILVILVLVHFIDKGVILWAQN